jgi:hypothetical protein
LLQIQTDGFYSLAIGADMTGANPPPATYGRRTLVERLEILPGDGRDDHAWAPLGAHA